MDCHLSNRDELLKEEYFKLQDQYEGFDNRAVTIKGWVVAGAIAALAISFNKSYRLASVIPVFVAIIVAVVWYLETKWKMFQYALEDRITLIEEHFRKLAEADEKELAPLQIYASWYAGYSKVRQKALWYQAYLWWLKVPPPKPKPTVENRWPVGMQFFVCAPISVSSYSALFRSAFYR